MGSNMLFEPRAPLKHTHVPGALSLLDGLGDFHAWGCALSARLRLRARCSTAGGRHDRLIAAGRGFAHRFQALGVGHERRGLAVAQGTAGGEGQGDRSGGNVVRHLGDEHSVILPECEVGVLHLSTELLDGRPHRLKAILRIGDEPRECFRRVTYLMKKVRHGRTSLFEATAKRSTRGRNTWGLRDYAPENMGCQGLWRAALTTACANSFPLRLQT